MVLGRALIYLLANEHVFHFVPILGEKLAASNLQHWFKSYFLKQNLKQKTINEDKICR